MSIIPNNTPFDYVPIFTLDKDQYLKFYHKIMIEVGANTIKLDPANGVFVNDAPIGEGNDVVIEEIIITGLDRKIEMNVTNGLVFSLCPGGDNIYNSFGNFGARLDKTATVSIGTSVLDEVLLGRLGSYFSNQNLSMPSTAKVVIGGSVFGKPEIDYVNVTVPAEIANIGSRINSLTGDVLTIQNSLTGTIGRVSVLETWRVGVDSTLALHTNRLNALESSVTDNTISITELTTKIANVENVEIPSLRNADIALDLRVANLELSVESIPLLETRVATLETISAPLPGLVADLDTRVDSLEVNLAGIPAAVTGNTNSILALEGRVTLAEAEIISNESSIVSLNNSLVSLESRTTAVEATVVSNTANLAAFKTSAEGRLDSLEEGFLELGATVSQQTTAISGIESRLLVVENDVEGLATDVAVIVDDVSSLQLGLADVEANVNTLQEEVGDLGPRVSSLEENVGVISSQLATVSSTVATHELRITTLENADGPDPVVLPYYIKGTLIDFGAGKTKVEESLLTLGSTAVDEFDLEKTKINNGRFDVFGQQSIDSASFPLHINTATGKIQYGTVPSESTVLPEYVQQTSLLFPNGTTVEDGTVKVSNPTGDYISISPEGIESQSTAGNTVVTSQNLEVLRKISIAPNDEQAPVTGDRFIFKTPLGEYKATSKQLVVPDYIKQTGLDFGGGIVVTPASIGPWNATTALFDGFANVANPDNLKRVFYDPILNKIKWGTNPPVTTSTFGETTIDTTGTTVGGTEGSILYGASGITFTKKPASLFEDFNLNLLSLATLGKIINRTTKGVFDPTVKYIGEADGNYFNVPLPSYLGTSSVQFGQVGVGSSLTANALSLGSNSMDATILGQLLGLNNRYSNFSLVTAGVGDTPVMYNPPTGQFKYSRSLYLPGASTLRSATFHGDGIIFSSTETNEKDNPQSMNFSRSKFADLFRFTEKTNATGGVPASTRYVGLDPVTGIYTMVSATDITTAAGAVLPDYIKPTNIDMSSGGLKTEVSPGFLYAESSNGNTSITAASVVNQHTNGLRTICNSQQVLAGSALNSGSMSMSASALRAVNATGREVSLGISHFDTLFGLNAPTASVAADLPNLRALCYDTTSGAIPGYKTVGFNNTFGWLKPSIIDSGSVKIDATKVSVASSASVGTDVITGGLSVYSGTNAATITPTSISMSSSSGAAALSYTNFVNLFRISNENTIIPGRKYIVTRSVDTSFSPTHDYSSTIMNRSYEALEESKINLTNVGTLDNTLSFGGEAPNQANLDVNGLWFTGTNSVYASSIARLGDTSGVHSILSKQLLQFNNGPNNFMELSMSGIKLRNTAGTGTVVLDNVALEKMNLISSKFNADATIMNLSVPGTAIAYGSKEVILTAAQPLSDGTTASQTKTISSSLFFSKSLTPHVVSIERIYGPSSTGNTQKLNFFFDTTLTNPGHYLKILRTSVKSSVLFDFGATNLPARAGSIPLFGVYTPGTTIVGFIVPDPAKPSYDVSIIHNSTSFADTFVCTYIDAYRGTATLWMNSTTSYAASQYWIVTAKIINLDVKTSQTIPFTGKIKFEYTGVG